MLKQYKWLSTIFLVLLLAFAGCTGQGLSTKPASALPSSQTAAPQAAAPGLASALTSLETTLESIYERVNPSVVNIRVVQKQQVSPSPLPQIPGFPFVPPQGPQQFRRGLGSGFVWSTEGYVVTNNHVVSGADSVTITFHDGTVVPATIVGTDPDSDLAVVRVQAAASQLQPVQMADSARVKVGQLAVAIGNPFGLQGTMTVGFISGLGRLLPADSESSQGPSYSIPDVIQTDAALNPGNSGGVLLNDAGKVIGVTSAIVSPAGTSVGIGFAIPSAIVQKVVPSLIKTGRYEHPWLGISGVSLSPDLSTAMALKSDQRGALIIDVMPNSPAAKAGLHRSERQVTIEGQQSSVGGDVIVAIDGHPIKRFDDLVTYLARSVHVDQTVSLTVLREGKEVGVKVTLVARPRA